MGAEHRVTAVRVWRDVFVHTSLETAISSTNSMTVCAVLDRTWDGISVGVFGSVQLHGLVRPELNECWATYTTSVRDTPENQLHLAKACSGIRPDDPSCLCSHTPLQLVTWVAFHVYEDDCVLKCGACSSYTVGRRRF